jgi:ribosomal protein S27AE
MSEEKFIISCPNCGPVEGYLSSDQDQEQEEIQESSEDLIEEQVFDLEGLPVTRLRCPRCGRWVPADQAAPE